MESKLLSLQFNSRQYMEIKNFERIINVSVKNISYEGVS